MGKKSLKFVSDSEEEEEYVPSDEEDIEIVPLRPRGSRKGKEVEESSNPPKPTTKTRSKRIITRKTRKPFVQEEENPSNPQSQASSPPHSIPSNPTSPRFTPTKGKRKMPNILSPKHKNPSITTYNFSHSNFNPLIMLQGNLEKYQKSTSQPILSGSKINFQHFPPYKFNVDIEDLFRHQGWLKFLNLEKEVYDVAMYSFYTNLYFVEPEEGEEIVYRTRFLNDIEFSETLIARLLDCPVDGKQVVQYTFDSFCAYPEGEDETTAAQLLFNNPNQSMRFPTIHSTNMTPEARVITNIIGKAIIPKGGNRAEFTNFHVLLTYCVMKRIRVCLPDLIIRIMFRVRSKQQSLCYGKLISLILEENGVDFKKINLRSIVNDPPFDKRNLSLMKIYAPGDHRYVIPPTSTTQTDPEIQTTSQHQPQNQPQSQPQTTPRRSRGQASSSAAPPSSDYITKEEFARFKKEERSKWSQMFKMVKKIFTCAGGNPDQDEDFQYVPPMSTPPPTPPRASTQSTAPSQDPSTVPSSRDEPQAQFEAPLSTSMQIQNFDPQSGAYLQSGNFDQFQSGGPYPGWF